MAEPVSPLADDLIRRLANALHSRVNYPGVDGYRAYQQDNDLLDEARAYLQQQEEEPKD